MSAFLPVYPEETRAGLGTVAGPLEAYRDLRGAGWAAD